MASLVIAALPVQAAATILLAATSKSPIKAATTDVREDDFLRLPIGNVAIASVRKMRGYLELGLLIDVEFDRDRRIFELCIGRVDRVSPEDELLAAVFQCVVSVTWRVSVRGKRSDAREGLHPALERFYLP
jgi:hypothetical protein